MTNEQKQLLLIDLCGRLPYGVKVHIKKRFGEWFYDEIEPYDRRLDCDVIRNIRVNEYTAKPYLRPMSSMTDEEWLAYCDMSLEDEKQWVIAGKGRRFTSIQHKEDFLNSHHFDYRGLIEKGLALEVPDDMYKI